MAYNDTPGIRDVAGEQKNPAIEEKQDDTITAIEALFNDVNGDGTIPPINERFDDSILDNQFPLTASQVATSEWRDLKDNPGGVAFFISDVAPTSAVVQFSEDGVTPLGGVVGSESFDLIESGPFTIGIYYHQQPPLGRYARVVYTNDAIDQDSIVGTPPSEFVWWDFRDTFNGTYIELSATISNFSRALLTRGVQAGTTFDGVFKNLQLKEHTNDTLNKPSALTNGTPAAFTVDDTTDIITATAHGMVDGDAVVFTTTTLLPTGLDDFTNDGLEVVYWVLNSTTNTFQVATAPSSVSAVDITTTGTGTHTYQQRGQFVGAFQDYSQVGHLLPFSINLSKPALQEIEWSDDGIEQITGTLLDSSAITTITLDAAGIGTLYISEISPLNLMIRSYGRLRVVNGPADWVAGLDEFVLWVGPQAYNGSYGPIDADLSLLSTALLARVVNAYKDADGNYRNARGQSRHEGNSSFGRTVGGGATTAGSPLLTADANSFFASDVGTTIEGDDLPPATTITRFIDDMTVEVSNNSTGTDTDVGFALGLLLGAGEIFYGEWLEWQDSYVKLISDIQSDVAGTLLIQQSQAVEPPNGAAGDAPFFLSDEHTQVYNPLARPLGKRQTQVQSRWVRHKYVNGPAGQTLMRLDAAFLTVDPGAPATPLGELPNKDMVSPVHRSIIAVENPTGDGYSEWRQQADGSMPVTITDFQAILKTGAAEDLTTQQFSVAQTPVRLDTPPIGDELRVIEVANAGRFHAFVAPNNAAVSETNGRPLFLGGNAIYLLDPTDTIYGITEDVGGSSQLVNENAGTTGGTATSPVNAQTNGAARAIRDTIAQTLAFSGFSFAHTLPFEEISRVRIGEQSRRDPATTYEEVKYAGITVGDAGDTGSVTTGDGVASDDGIVPIDQDYTYIVDVTRRNLASDVTSLTNTMGLNSVIGPTGDFELINTISNGGESFLTQYLITGTPTSAGTITANFDTAADFSCISVTRYRNVAAIQVEDNDVNGTTNGATVSGTVSATIGGMVHMAVGAEIANITSVNGSFTIRANYNSPAGFGSNINNDQMLMVATRPVATTGSKAWSATGAGGDKAGAVVSLFPGPAISPKDTISYTLSAVPGVTTKQLTWATTSDFSQFTDITADRAWVAADIANVEIFSTADVVGSADLQTRHFYIEVQEVSGAVTRISATQGRVEV